MLPPLLLLPSLPGSAIPGLAFFAELGADLALLLVVEECAAALAAAGRLRVATLLRVSVDTFATEAYKVGRLLT